MTRKQGDKVIRRHRRHQGEHRGRGAGEQEFNTAPCTPHAAPHGHPVTRHPSPAFTLTELLVVIAIIAILFGLLVAFYSPSQEQRKVFECQNRLQVIHRALKVYMLDWDGFPASPYDSLDNDRDGRLDEDPPDDANNDGNPDDDGDGQIDEDPINGVDDDGDGRVDEDSPVDNDNDLRFNEDAVDAQVGGLLTLNSYLRTQRALICPADPRGTTTPPFYSSYQGCDTGAGFFPPVLPITSVQTCLQGIPTYAITRFLPGDDCHPSSPNFLSQCTDPDKFRQLAVRNTSPYFPNPTFPADDTVITWCVHHRYISPAAPEPNYTKGGVPADVVLYWDGVVRVQRMRIVKTPCPPFSDWCPDPQNNWRRKPDEQ